MKGDRIGSWEVTGREILALILWYIHERRQEILALMLWYFNERWHEERQEWVLRGDRKKVTSRDWLCQLKSDPIFDTYVTWRADDINKYQSLSYDRIYILFFNSTIMEP